MIFLLLSHCVVCYLYVLYFVCIPPDKVLWFFLLHNSFFPLRIIYLNCITCVDSHFSFFWRICVCCIDGVDDWSTSLLFFHFMYSTWRLYILNYLPTCVYVVSVDIRSNGIKRTVYRGERCPSRHSKQRRENKREELLRWMFLYIGRGATGLSWGAGEVFVLKVRKLVLWKMLV